MTSSTEQPYYAKRCNICGSQQWKNRYHFKDFRGRGSIYENISVVQCLGCRIHRRMPEIIDEYEESYHAPYVEQGLSIHPHQLSHFADMSASMRSRFGLQGMKFLDVGCSTGRALRLAHTLGFVVTGFDVSEWATDHCHKLGFETHCAPSLLNLFEAQQFDVVHSSHTIEHVPDPVSYLAEFNRLLKPGGILMLACPNFHSFDRVFYGKQWGIWCLDSHLWQFGKKQLETLILANGFDMFSSRTLHGRNSNKKWKRIFWNSIALLGYSDGLNITARKVKEQHA
jgi:2-polyprenyl-3-methyl-5-hydroxy-6-metoxy-1,4-benzoquinol methylase